MVAWTSASATPLPDANANLTIDQVVAAPHRLPSLSVFDHGAFPQTVHPCDLQVHNTICSQPSSSQHPCHLPEGVDASQVYGSSLAAIPASLDQSGPRWSYHHVDGAQPWSDSTKLPTWNDMIRPRHFSSHDQATATAGLPPMQGPVTLCPPALDTSPTRLASSVTFPRHQHSPKAPTKRGRDSTELDSSMIPTKKVAFGLPSELTRLNPGAGCLPNHSSNCPSSEFARHSAGEKSQMPSKSIIDAKVASESREPQLQRVFGESSSGYPDHVTFTPAPFPEASEAAIADACRAHLGILFPRLGHEMIVRVVRQQIERYRQLTELRELHQAAVADEQCLSGAQCIGIGVRRDSLAHSCVSDATGPAMSLPENHECPLCFAVRSFKKPIGWAQHLFKDLRPYFCPFSDCENTTLWKHKNDWVKHDWKCHSSQSTWRELDSALGLKKHRVTELHDRFVNGSIDQPDIAGVVGKSHPNRTRTRAFEQCVFCGRSIAGWYKFRDHVAGHMEQICVPMLELFGLRVPPVCSLPTDWHGNILNFRWTVPDSRAPTLQPASSLPHIQPKSQVAIPRSTEATRNSATPSNGGASGGANGATPAHDSRIVERHWANENSFPSGQRPQNDTERDAQSQTRTPSMRQLPMPPSTHSASKSPAPCVRPPAGAGLFLGLDPVIGGQQPIHFTPPRASDLQTGIMSSTGMGPSAGVHSPTDSAHSMGWSPSMGFNAPMDLDSTTGVPPRMIFNHAANRLLAATPSVGNSPPACSWPGTGMVPAIDLDVHWNTSMGVAMNTNTSVGSPHDSGVNSIFAPKHGKGVNSSSEKVVNPDSSKGASLGGNKGINPGVSSVTAPGPHTTARPSGDKAVIGTKAMQTRGNKATEATGGAKAVNAPGVKPSTTIPRKAATRCGNNGAREATPPHAAPDTVRASSSNCGTGASAAPTSSLGATASESLPADQPEKLEALPYADLLEPHNDVWMEEVYQVAAGAWSERHGDGDGGDGGDWPTAWPGSLP